MIVDELVEEDDTPRGTYLFDVMQTEAGQSMFMYILYKLGYFSEVNGEKEAAVRNAAIKMAQDVLRQTGFVFDINLVR